MPKLAEIVNALESIAPLPLAEDWDNVGLLVGDPNAEVGKALTCLTLTPDVAAEAISCGAKLVISHHPILFRPIRQITSETWDGRMLLDLVRAGVAVYSAHSAFDSARNGINAQLAELFELTQVEPLRPKVIPAEAGSSATAQPVGAGRSGQLPAPLTLNALVGQVKAKLRIDTVQFAGDGQASIKKLGIACGSGAEFLADAHRAGCQALLTGEARFHSCIEAREIGVALILAGHYATERPAMERWAENLSRHIPGLNLNASRAETDPVQCL